MKKHNDIEQLDTIDDGEVFTIYWLYVLLLILFVSCCCMACGFLVGVRYTTKTYLQYNNHNDSERLPKKTKKNRNKREIQPISQYQKNINITQPRTNITHKSKTNNNDTYQPIYTMNNNNNNQLHQMNQIHDINQYNDHNMSNIPLYDKHILQTESNYIIKNDYTSINIENENQPLQQLQTQQKITSKKKPKNLIVYSDDDNNSS